MESTKYRAILKYMIKTVDSIFDIPLKMSLLFKNVFYVFSTHRQVKTQNYNFFIGK